MRVLLLLAIIVGCASTTHRDFRHHDDACKRENVDSTRSSHDACTFDSDCAFCHDGTDCGTVTTAANVQARGAACQKPDAAQCELASARCCGGVCVVSGWAAD
jgi:hypothetical protein